MKTDEKFWILWCPTSGKPPTRKFFREEDALKIAEKMAVEHPGSEFIVMMSIMGLERSKKVEKKKYSRLSKVKKTVEGKKEVSGMENLRLTYREWQERGRQVKKGEKSEKVFTSPGVFNYYKNIFRYDQTEPVGSRGSL